MSDNKSESLSNTELLNELNNRLTTLTRELNLSSAAKEFRSIENLGDRILNERKKQSLSRPELADLSGVSIQTIAKIENNSTMVQLNLVLALLDALGMALWVS